MKAFHLGSVTDRNGNECGDAAYITVGSDHGQDPDDCGIEITGHEAAKIARLIATAPDMLALLKDISEMYHASQPWPDDFINRVELAITRAGGRTPALTQPKDTGP